MRTGYEPVLDLQRKANRSFFNPRALQQAGRPNGPAAVIEHTGRTSGHQYRTPVHAVPIEGGFTVAAVYGTRADWIRNVLAGGPAAVEFEGLRSRVGAAQVVPMAEVAHAFSAGDLRTARAFAVDEAVRLWTEPGPESLD